MYDGVEDDVYSRVDEFYFDIVRQNIKGVGDDLDAIRRLALCLSSLSPSNLEQMANGKVFDCGVVLPDKDEGVRNACRCTLRYLQDRKL